jgi:3-oxoacyl-[acyl-carrier protein] reductase
MKLKRKGNGPVKGKRVIVVGGSRGIGKAICTCLAENHSVNGLSSKELDTSDINQIRQFCKKEKALDVLVFNTGGPPPKALLDLSEGELDKYYNQLFKSFFLMLQSLRIKKNGFVFLISSFNIKEPNQSLILSNTFRIAAASLLKSYSKIVSKDGITTLNIAPGPMDTTRLDDLKVNKGKLINELPLKRLPKPKEIGQLIELVVSNNLKSLNGTTIYMDGGISNYVL